MTFALGYNMQLRLVNFLCVPVYFGSSGHKADLSYPISLSSVNIYCNYYLDVISGIIILADNQASLTSHLHLLPSSPSDTGIMGR